MPRRAFLTLVLGVTGNVNADAGVGIRVPMKKVVSWNKEVRAFVSPRCVRRGIRTRLSEKGFQIDPQTLERGDQLTDVGDPIKYVDDDLFGYLAPEKGEKKVQPARSGPVKVSPLIALHHTEISVEFAGRFPRADISPESEDANPVPFEIETAQWLGSMHVIISEDVGRFRSDELTGSVLEKLRGEYSPRVSASGETYQLRDDERRARIRALAEILLREGWTFPRGSEATSHPEFHYAVLLLSESFVPMANVLRMNEDLSLDYESLKEYLKVYEWDKAFIIDYRRGSVLEISKGSGELTESKLSEGALDVVIEAVADYLLRGRVG